LPIVLEFLQLFWLALMRVHYALVRAWMQIWHFDVDVVGIFRIARDRRGSLASHVSQ
jgi:hypothetical protein